MSPQDTLAAYQAHWNSHDAKGLAATFSPGGLYSDPGMHLPAHPYDLGTVVEALARPFPDFHFAWQESAIAGHRAFLPWTLTGTNSAPLRPGIEPTGKKLHLPGIDVLELCDQGIASACRHFDQKTLAEQIGMQVVIEPVAQGPASFGYSKRVHSGNLESPAILATTWIEFKDQSELDHIRSHSAVIIGDCLAESGFISIVTGAAGRRAFTVTAWSDEAALYRALDKGHARAKHDFRTGDLAPAVWTAVWKPGHINRLWVRCPQCAQPNDASRGPRTCEKCGTGLPSHSGYW